MCAPPFPAAAADARISPSNRSAVAVTLPDSTLEAPESTQKLRVFVAPTRATESDRDEPVGFVMVPRQASLVDIRAEILDDELDVPTEFAFVVDGDIAKPSQERKIRAEHFLPGGCIRVSSLANVARPDELREPLKEPQTDAMAMISQKTGLSDSNPAYQASTDLPVLAGYLSSKHGMFSSWQQRYFRLSNGTLSYFATPNDKVANGSVVIDETCTVQNAGDKYKKKFCFEVCTWRGHLAVCAECDEDLQLWKAHIALTVRYIEHLASQKGIKRGQVHKRDGFFRKWKPKWAVLSRTMLSFYDCPDDPAKQRAPTDEFDLAGATVCAEEVEGRPFCFTIRQSQCELIEMSASDKESLNSWLACLAQNIANAQSNMSPLSVNEDQASWGVNGAIKHPKIAGPGWGFDVMGVESIEVKQSRHTRINGEKTTEFFFKVNHRSGSMSWLISRQLNDVLDLHDAFKNTDPAKHGYLQKFIQVPVDNKTKELNAMELEQNKTVIRVYMEEALKQAVPAEYESLERLLSPTIKGFDEQQGYLSVARRACVSNQLQRRWCRLSSRDHTFSWSVDEKSRKLQLDLQNAILISKVRSQSAQYCSL